MSPIENKILYYEKEDYLQKDNIPANIFLINMKYTYIHTYILIDLYSESIFEKLETWNSLLYHKIKDRGILDEKPENTMVAKENSTRDPCIWTQDMPWL